MTYRSTKPRYRFTGARWSPHAPFDEYVRSLYPDFIRRGWQVPPGAVFAVNIMTRQIFKRC